MGNTSEPNLPANLAVENARLRAVFDFFQHIGDADTGKFEVGKDFSRPFSVERSDIEEIDAHIRRKFEKHSLANIEFVGNVKFADASNRRFDNLDDLLQDSANDKAPEYLSLQWKAFELVDDGKPHLAKVSIKFSTEKRKDQRSTIFVSIGDPVLGLTVEGSSDVWTADTFETTRPFCENLCLSAPLSWLRIFGESSVVMLAVMLVLTSAFGYVQFWWRGQQLLEKQSKVHGLLEDFGKIPSSNGQMYKIYEAVLKQDVKDVTDFSVATFPLMILSMIVALYFVPKFFSYLHPSSYIFIGLTGKSRQRYLNLVKFIVVNVIIIGIILPILMKFVLE